MAAAAASVIMHSVVVVVVVPAAAASSSVYVRVLLKIYVCITGGHQTTNNVPNWWQNMVCVWKISMILLFTQIPSGWLAGRAGRTQHTVWLGWGVFAALRTVFCICTLCTHYIYICIGFHLYYLYFSWFGLVLVVGPIFSATEAPHVVRTNNQQKQATIHIIRM